MSWVLSDDITLIAPAPNGAPNFSATVVGQPGPQQFWYWLVTQYPIGTVVTGPVLVRNAPQPLSASNFVRLVWNPAESLFNPAFYTVLRTPSPQFPSSFPAVCALTNNPIEETTIDDTGEPLNNFFGPFPPAAPVDGRIHLNNRDYFQPTIEILDQNISFKVNSLTFPDNSVIFSAPSQTPWRSDIDGAFHNLFNVAFLTVQSPPTFGSASVNIISADGGVANLILTGPPALPWSITTTGFAGPLFNPGTLWFRTVVQGQNLATLVLVPPAVIGGAGSVGVNINRPAYALDVVGDVNCTGVFRVNGVPIGGGGGSQTPWLSNISAAGFWLTGVARVFGNNSLYIGSVANGSVVHFYMEPAGTVPSTRAYGNLNHVLTSTGTFNITLADNGLAITATPTGFVALVPNYPLDVRGDINTTGVYRVNGVPLATGQSQTPWLSNISGGFFQLSGVSAVGIGLNLAASQTGLFIARATTTSAAIQISGAQNSTDFGVMAASIEITNGNQATLQLGVAGANSTTSFEANNCTFRMSHATIPSVSGGDIVFQTNLTQTLLRLSDSGSVIINTGTAAGATLSLLGLPTSSAGLATGNVWNNGGVLNIV